MNAAELLAQADVPGALAALTEEVRAKPGNFKQRVFSRNSCVSVVCNGRVRSINSASLPSLMPAPSP